MHSNIHDKNNFKLSLKSLGLPIAFVLVDIIICLVVWVLGVYLRFDFHPDAKYVMLLLKQLPVFVLIKLVVSYYMGIYSRMWKFMSAGDCVSITLSSLVIIILSMAYGYLTSSLLPRGVYAIVLLVGLILMGCSRLAVRFYSYMNIKEKIYDYFYPGEDKEKVLIVGAGDCGHMLAREIELYHKDETHIVGFIDDDYLKKGLKLRGFKILGTRADITRIAKEEQVDKIIIAIPSASPHVLRPIIETCQATGAEVSITPGLWALKDGNVSLKELRPINIEDLLGRESIHLEQNKVSEFIKDKIVLVTGGGGSIGSEIARQVARMEPKKLLLLGKGENSIYEIWQELKKTQPGLKVVPVIADVRDENRMEGIFSYFKPQVVFHAAAHKHVPLMEYQPMEAVRNNCAGTRVCANMAAKYDAEAFVMISTDKAVNPTSVMGCTKRVAEMYVQSMNNISNTRYVAVRFGNVLGSRGSVVPLFKKQIAAGGPVTVTHPEMKRYFMTIPEASQLVLQAGAMAQGGEVFVLDMGEPVKIVDLAKDLISLSGLVPERDIKIEFTGLRPGEKLFEELLSAEDGTENTENKSILKARIIDNDNAEMNAAIDRLLALEDDEEIIQELMNVVPWYKPNRIDDNMKG